MLFLFLLGFPLSATRAAGDPGCIAAFYQTKDLQCVASVLASLPKSGPAADTPGTANNQAIIGFLAEIFQSYSDEKQRILKSDEPRHTRVILIEALYDANLPDEATTYSVANGLPDVVGQLRNRAWGPVRLLRRSVSPAQNDLLIGAYMASGNARYIEYVLTEFANAEDAMAGDAFRIALMKDRFGTALTPPGRQATTLVAACQKYGCKSDMRNLMRLMTLSRGFWAVQSLSRRDEGIRNTIAGVFDRDPRLKRLFFAEQNAFANYLTTFALFAAKISDPRVEASLEAFETLRPENEATDAMMGKTHH